jgi:hypothetical protein
MFAKSLYARDKRSQNVGDFLWFPVFGKLSVIQRSRKFNVRCHSSVDSRLVDRFRFRQLTLPSSANVRQLV